MKAFVAALLLLIAGGAWAGSSTGSTTKKPMNILFILLDDVGRQPLSIDSQQTFVPTPNLDQFASESLKLVNFYGQSVCGATRASILTGWSGARTLEETGPPVYGYNQWQPLWPLVINKHHDGGVQIGLFGKSGTSPSQTTAWNEQTDSNPPDINSGYPWNNNRERKAGFNFFDGFHGVQVTSENDNWERFRIDPDRAGYEPDDARTWWDIPCSPGVQYDRVQTDYYTAPYPYWTGSAQCDELAVEAIDDAAIAWIEKQNERGNPWIAWVSQAAVHSPYTIDYNESRYCDDGNCPELSPSSTDEFNYLAEMDRELGRLLEKFQKPNTLIILTGDNGSTLNFGGGKNRVLDLGNNMGAYVWYEGITPRSTEALHGMTDLFPTFLELTKTPMPTVVPNFDDDTRMNGQPYSSSGKSMVDTIFNAPDGNQYTFGIREGVRWIREGSIKLYDCSCVNEDAGNATADICTVPGTYGEVVTQMNGGLEDVQEKLCNVEQDCFSTLSQRNRALLIDMREALLLEVQGGNPSITDLDQCYSNPLS